MEVMKITSRVFPGWFIKGDLVCLKCVSSVFQGCVNAVLEVFIGVGVSKRFWGISEVFHGCYPILAM